MENKRLTRKLNSFFWWFLMALPLILMVIVFICAIPQYAKNFDWSGDGWLNFLDYIFNSSDSWYYFFTQFNDMSITHVFTDVFNYFELENYYFAYFFNWCASIYLYHLIFDCVVFIFDWLHDFFERG